MAKNMKNYKDYRTNQEKNFSLLVDYPSNANRPIFGLLDKTKHELLVVFSVYLSKNKEKISINESDLNKILSVRSDYLTIEYIIVIIDKIFPGYRERIKRNIFNKLSENNKSKLFTNHVGPNLVTEIIPCDNLILLCEQQGISDLSDAFKGQQFLSEPK